MQPIPGDNALPDTAAPRPAKPLPHTAQQPATANRDSVRKTAPVRAPRQSNRPIERSR